MAFISDITGYGTATLSLMKATANSKQPYIVKLTLVLNTILAIDRINQRFDLMKYNGEVLFKMGIPLLRNPTMIKASQASYLDDNDIVFGIEMNGDVCAYPKRILAWHDMFTDTIGGVDITGVYCTLCCMVIPFRSQHKGVKHVLGTSGFLYRSNKLMYDKATQSLWSTT